MRLDECIGAIGFDNLISSINPPAEPFGILLRKGQGKLKRGTALALSSLDGTMVILGTETGESETYTANCILAEDCETETTSNSVAVGYRTGHFNGNYLKVKTGYTITGPDKEALRGVGILLSDAI